MFLIRDERGQPFTLPALRKRFKRLAYDWQIRDLRAKAASDSNTSKEAQTLLGHAAASFNRFPSTLERTLIEQAKSCFVWLDPAPTQKAALGIAAQRSRRYTPRAWYLQISRGIVDQLRLVLGPNPVTQSVVQDGVGRALWIEFE